jgi:hypothetical protein
MTGYSGTPLVQKLGIKPGFAAFVVRPPVAYGKLVADLPKGLVLRTKPGKDLDFVHCFATTRKELERDLPLLMKQIKPAGMIWVSWPKKTSGVATNITEDVIREVALPLGLVDVKVCAVTEVWSGLKLVIRKTERG